MAKQTGLGANFYVGGFDVSGDTQDIKNITGGPRLWDVTDITQSGRARLGLQRSGDIAWTSFFDPSVSGEHAALSGLPTADVTASVFLNPLLPGSPAASCTAKLVTYETKRTAAGELTVDFAVQSNGFGVEWCDALTGGKRTDSAATVGPFFDNSAAFNFGAQAYFQVFAFTGTSAVIDIQHATTSGGAYSSTGLTTSSIVSAPQTQRLATANNVTINQFLKVVTTGTFSNLVFAVMINVNPIAGVVF